MNQPKWKQVLSSRKFWAAVAGLLVVLLQTWRTDFPIEPETLGKLLYVIAAYILGTAIEDGMRAEIRDQ